MLKMYSILTTFPSTDFLLKFGVLNFVIFLLQSTFGSKKIFHNLRLLILPPDVDRVDFRCLDVASLAALGRARHGCCSVCVCVRGRLAVCASNLRASTTIIFGAKTGPGALGDSQDDER